MKKVIVPIVDAVLARLKNAVDESQGSGKRCKISYDGTRRIAVVGNGGGKGGGANIQTLLRHINRSTSRKTETVENLECWSELRLGCTVDKGVNVREARINTVPMLLSRSKHHTEYCSRGKCQVSSVKSVCHTQSCPPCHLQ